MRMKPIALLALFAAAACDDVPRNSAYFNRGPESLLDVSSEVVNLPVSTPAEIATLRNWIEQDVPTRAELYCPDGDAQCGAAHGLLQSHGISTSSAPGNYTVALVYERLLARDCRQKYYNNSENHWNKNHPAFACSVSANTVMMVSDKQQFVNPELTDAPRATGAVDAYGRAYTPPPAPQANDIRESVVQSARSD